MGGVKFSGPVRFLKKGFCSNFFQLLNSMLGLVKFSQSGFYIEYSIYTHILVLRIKACQLFRNCMSDATDN